MIKITFLILIAHITVFAQNPLEADVQYEDSVSITEQDTNQIDHSGGFSFKAYSIDLHTALALFAQSAGLTLRSEVPLEGNRSIEFNNKDLNTAIETILAPDTIPWMIQENSLIVGKRPEPTIKKQLKALQIEGDNNYRIITIDYPRTLRKRTSAFEGSVNGLNGKAAEVSIVSEDETDFWKEIETMVNALKSDEGIFSINFLTGVIYLQDQTANLNAIQNYLQKVVPILTRQVKITARIYEVTLSDDNALGIDWSFTSQKNIGTLDQGSSFSTATDYTDGYKPNVLTANLGFVESFNVMINALSEQGDLRSVSQPRIITMHNQPAIVKVGTLYPYFTTLVQVDPQTGIRNITETVEVISLGTWLSITPQISRDSTITLLVDPVLSDLTGTVTSIQGATAPIVDIKQSSSILRVRDRETVRISGLQQTKDQSIQRKVPLLGDIPVLGSLFRWSYESKVRKELVIFITTEVVD